MAAFAVTSKPFLGTQIKKTIVSRQVEIARRGPDCLPAPTDLALFELPSALMYVAHHIHLELGTLCCLGARIRMP